MRDRFARKSKWPQFSFLLQDAASMNWLSRNGTLFGRHTSSMFLPQQREWSTLAQRLLVTHNLSLEFTVSLRHCVSLVKCTFVICLFQLSFHIIFHNIGTRLIISCLRGYNSQAKWWSTLSHSWLVLARDQIFLLSQFICCLILLFWLFFQPAKAYSGTEASVYFHFSLTVVFDLYFSLSLSFGKSSHLVQKCRHGWASA